MSNSPLKDINQYLTACKCSYDKCIDVIEHTEKLDDVRANLRFHHLKFDGNGQPMIDTLAEKLYEHIIDYCLSAKDRKTELTPQQSARLTKEARQLFRHPDISTGKQDITGEAGEMLLYFLVESVLKAPQVVAKMDLKTNRKLESNGSDGIHMSWNEEDELVDIYFGEAKLHQTYGNAIKDALKSINSFHDENLQQHEYRLATKHFKYVDETIQKEVVNLLEGGKTNSGVRINHACLIGYDSINYKNLPNTSNKNQLKEFKKRYLKHTKKLTKSVQENFKTFEKKHLCFEVFFIPFPTVQEFRDAFNKALD